MNNQAIIDTTTKQDEYIEILKKHFPSVINQLDDGSYVIDKEQLQLMVEPKNCKIVEDGYGLKWVGKKEAYHNAYIHNKKILKPLVEDSKHFDTTGNILIKGDNLEALKLLKNNYFEKIKMIYIDPPYNTQSDGFIYNDNFTKSQEDVLEELGYSEEQKEYIKNIAGAKTHSGWLNFMYPRLLLARDLLKDDGVIFISIDDNEVAQLKLLCDEIFGQENFIELFTWDKKNSAKGVPTKSMVVNIHEYVFCYSKSEKSTLFGEERTKVSFSNPDNDPRGLWRLSNIKSTIEKQDSKFTITNPKTGDEFINYWAFSYKTLQRMITENRIVFPKEKTGLPKQKEFFNEFLNPNIPIKSNLSLFDAQDTSEKKIDIMLGAKVFPYRKPIKLIKKLITQAGNNENNIILDFFAGSGTTGDAVMQLNAEDGGSRKYILVQLPEPIDQKKDQVIFNFINNMYHKQATIFEITAERLRRAGDKIIKDNLESKEPKDLGTLDIGFKVYEIANDEYNSIYDKKISEVNQQELELLSKDEYHRADNLTILTNLLLGSGITLNTKVKTVIEDCLYQVEDKLFILKEFDLKSELFINIEYTIVYARYFTNDSFIANLTSFIDNDKIIIKN